MTRHAYRHRNRELTKNIFTVLFIAAFAAAVFGINAIGGFIAEKIIVPVVGTVTVEKSGSAVQTKSITVPEMKIYAVSLGKAETVASAKTLASQIAASGGAGFIYKKSDSEFFVIASAYNTSSGAKSVVEKLGASGSKAEVIECVSDKMTLKITALSEQIAEIEQTLSVLNKCAGELLDKCILLDSADITRLQAKAFAQAKLGELSTLSTTLKDYNSSNTALKEICRVAGEVCAALNEISENDSDDFAQAFRLNALSAVFSVVEFGNQIE